ncbi:alkaline phosphatase PhoX [Nevskia sp.]|uniref:alkaline phosphatase PhoX n=1 Tax=Nevskia sp. TaxID=1929292 RepID=UPI0025FCFDD5|nr:alkaline phosphatase PhoX [Nevskia sp.]
MRFDPVSRRWHRRRKSVDRRSVLRGGLLGLGLVAVGGSLASCTGSGGNDDPANPAPGGGDPVAPTGAVVGDLGPLSTTPDANDLLLPAGFTATVIGRAGQFVPGTGFRWHSDPDGGAVFARPGGGWVYVSNREFLPGGVDAIEFSASGSIVRAYNILPGPLTRINCGGGVSPWNTWFSGEEFETGVIWECDPFGVEPARRLTALGTFKHEAVAVDPATNAVYLTEDETDGRFYRFLPTAANAGGRADLTSGRLQVMRVLADAALVNTPGQGGRFSVDWLDVPTPNPLLGGLVLATPTRRQVPESFAFDGGEGIWHQRGVIYFSTKGDRRVWALDIAAQAVEVIYDDFAFATPPLTSVDNIVMTPGGDVIVVEDQNAEQSAVAITPSGRFQPLVQLGVSHVGSEVTGPAFSPDGRFFYFSSQRGTSGRAGVDGVTYAVEGPWLRGV